ncbi:hypothetical protein N9M22_02175 [Litoricolaceae bacterium]|nr:hypothetical protein [Litorivicinaceae bacterium]
MSHHDYPAGYSFISGHTSVRFQLLNDWLDVCSTRFTVNFLEIWSVDVFAGTLGFVVTIAVISLLDVLIDKYQYRSELTGF